MLWNPSHIMWPQQLMILSIVLPPIFIAFIALAFGAPRLLAAKRAAQPKEHQTSSQAVPVSRS